MVIVNLNPRSAYLLLINIPWFERWTCPSRSGTLAPVSLDSCQVSQDSKKDVSVGGDGEQCAHEDFSPDPWPTSERRLPFSLRPYLFQVCTRLQCVPDIRSTSGQAKIDQISEKTI